MFWTSFSFSTIVANYKKNDSCAEFFDANFEQQSVLRPISSNRTVAHGVWVKFQLFNKSRLFRTKWELCKAFWRQFFATGKLRKGFWTSFSLLTKVTNFKHNDSFGECFDANFEQQECCARCLGQILAFKQKGPFSRKRQLRRAFWRQFRETGQLRTLFHIPSEQYWPLWRKTTVVKGDLRPISSNSTVAHAAF